MLTIGIVEQPVGVGFSQGVPNITNEVELGLELAGFYKQFTKTFDVAGWDLYLTGESYAGYVGALRRGQQTLLTNRLVVRSLYCRHFHHS